jgi:transposase
VRKPFVYATVFSDPERGVVIDVAPGRDAAAIWAFSGLYSRSERAQVQIVSMDCHVPYRYMVRLVFPHALIVADAFHLHRRVLPRRSDSSAPLGHPARRQGTLWPSRTAQAGPSRACSRS